MSWMDSWSRPGKHAAVPPPLYLTQGEDVPYCKTCGRVISSRKQQQNRANTIKYCSDRCRNRKPGPIDRRIESTIVGLLNADEGSGIEKTAAKKKSVKGDRRIVVTCDEIEEIVFERQPDPSKTFGRRKNRATRALQVDGDDEWKSVDMVDKEDSTLAPRQAQEDPDSKIRQVVRPSQVDSDVNGSVGGEKGLQERHEETCQEYDKRLEGQQRAEEREMVRRAARRGIVFGLVVTGSDEPEIRRKCEAVMNGAVVEPSFAKGNWAIRWREG